MVDKPIRVFYSPLSGRFYASSRYKGVRTESHEQVTITGAKYDVTDDIARAVVEHDLEFTPITTRGRAGTHDSKGNEIAAKRAEARIRELEEAK